MTIQTKISSLLVAALMLASGCTDDFEQINTNPNNPETAPLTNVFAYSLQTLSGRFGHTEMRYPAVFAGYISKHNYVDAIRYSSPPDASHWDWMYVNLLTNLHYVIEGAAEEKNTNLQAAAMIIKAYVMQMLVDTYGPVPYFEAGNGDEGNTAPAFDPEEVIYNDLLTQLKKAHTMLRADAGIMGDGDLLYNGNTDQWKKLANSLRLRIAIRMSDVDEATAKAEIAEILGAPVQYPVITANADNAKIKYPGGEWIEPWTSQHNAIGDDRIAKPIVDKLLDLNDPRIHEYAGQTSNSDYVGLEIGAQTQGDESMLDSAFVNNEAGTVYFMKYCEVGFIRAEAIARNFISGNAEEAYNAAVTASMEEYDIDSTAISNYLAQTGVAWDGSLEKLYTQKWISLFRQSWEAWAEVRRTDVPVIGPAKNASKTGHTRSPFRFPYPLHEKNMNGNNIPGNVNENDIYWGYQSWWDTLTGVE